MKVPELLKSLALGELSNLSLANPTTGEITPEKIPTVIMYANEALLKLHTKYVLKEKDLILEMRTGVTFYHFLKKFAYSEFDELNPPDEWNLPYIMDLGREPFTEDVIKVLSVFDPYGRKLPLNDREHVASVFTTQSNVLQVPHTEDGKTLAVEYQAKHPTLPETGYEDTLIELPECLHAALRAHIAWKVFMHMNTQECTAKGQEHAMNFEMLCQEAVDLDLVSTSSSTTNTRFEKRGFI